MHTAHLQPRNQLTYRYFSKRFECTVDAQALISQHSRYWITHFYWQITRRAIATTRASIFSAKCVWRLNIPIKTIIIHSNNLFTSRSRFCPAHSLAAAPQGRRRHRLWRATNVCVCDCAKGNPAKEISPSRNQTLVTFCSLTTLDSLRGGELILKHVSFTPYTNRFFFLRFFCRYRLHLSIELSTEHAHMCEQRTPFAWKTCCCCCWNSGLRFFSLDSILFLNEKMNTYSSAAVAACDLLAAMGFWWVGLCVCINYI